MNNDDKKIAVITGSNRGLGLELVKKFLQNDWHVIAACRNTADFPSGAAFGDRKPLVWQLDVANQASLDSFAERCDKELSRVDVLINNAGIYDNVGDGESPYDRISQLIPVFVINSIAPRLLSDKLFNVLQKSENKVVITISSHFGAHSTIDEFMAEHWGYSASKAAVNYAMDAFAKLHPDVKSLLVHPGWMRTRLGGPEAPVDPMDSASGIYDLYERADKLDSGKLFRTDGATIEW
jgi:NAD(P)-dependent dehydrogenase (short-subunit alcohol dehydrogenase family)